MNFGLPYGVHQGLTYFTLIFIASFVLIWLLMGGMMVWRHYLIRFLLYKSGVFPWRIIPFLEEAKMRILMKRIGGGYSFIHRLLLDYLAGHRD
jgi:hypothetical protein